MVEKFDSHIYVFINMPVYTHAGALHTHTHIYIYICKYIYKHMNAHVLTRMCEGG